MASLTRRPNGHWWIQYVDVDKSRKTLRLGKVSKRHAEATKLRAEQLLAAKALGHSVDGDTAGWLARLDSAMLEKLEAVRLIEPQRRASATLGPFIAEYVKGRTDVKPATKEIWRQGERSLLEFFGDNKPLSDVTPGDADRYKLHLVGKKLAPMTVRKRLQFATMIFRAAMRQRLLPENPFCGVTVPAVMPDKARFITPEETELLLAAAPSVAWRTLIALSRWGGVRVPSEALSLQWSDVNWERGTIAVPEPKVEHHPGRGVRLIPLFEELEPILAEAFEAAPEGAQFVISDERLRRGIHGDGGWRNANLRTQFLRIIKRAGLQPWPRPFHAMRSSRQTELAERFPAHVVCAWLGNSEAVARQHYLQVTPEHFAAARGEAKGEAKSEAHPKHFAKQPEAARVRTGSHDASVTTDGDDVCAVSCETLPHKANASRNRQSGWGGIRTPGTV